LKLRFGLRGGANTVKLSIMSPQVCPNCGAEVPEKAKACPACGSDEQTGWSENAHASGLNLPDDSFDYNEFVEREFGPPKMRPKGVSRFWWVVAVMVVSIFLWAGFKWLL
jgi:ribosomal protein L40E